MKNPWKIVTGLAVLCAAASMSAQAQVFDFKTFPTGELNSNPGWTGGGTFYPVTNGVGVVVPDDAGNNAVRRVPGIKASEYTVGAEFRFSETAATTATDFRPVLEIGIFVPGTEVLNLRLTRRDTLTDSGYQASFARGLDAVPLGTFNTGIVADTLLGFDFANGDADSARLYLTFTIVKGALPGDNWTATTRLYNLDTDPTMMAPIISQNNLAVNPLDALWGEALNPYMNNIASKTSGDMTGLTVESFTVIATPDPEPGTPVSIDEHFTAAEGYADGALNGPWSGSLASFTVNSSGTGTVLLSATEAFRSVTHETLLAINDRYTVGMDFSFNRATGDITDNNNALFKVLLSDGSTTIQFGLSRQDGVGQGAMFKLRSNSNSNLSVPQFPSGPTFSEVLLGFADPSDNTSDQLRMEATVQRGASDTDWTATIAIRNLTTNMTVAEWPRTGTFYLFSEALLRARMSIDETDATLAVSNRVVDRFFASSFTPAPAAGFASWIEGFDLDPADQDPTDDPDNDGIDNLLEFVLNGNPSVSDPSILPDLLVKTDNFEFTFQRRDDSVSPETTQIFEWGTTLVTWPGSALIPAESGPVGPATITVTAGVPDDGVTDTVKISIPKTADGGAGKLFGRLQVVTP